MNGKSHFLWSDDPILSSELQVSKTAEYFLPLHKVVMKGNWDSYWISTNRENAGGETDTGLDAKEEIQTSNTYNMLNNILTKVFSSVQSLSHVRLFATPWIAARQASLSITNSQSLPKLMSNESVMPSSHLILCHPLLLLPPIPPSIRVLSSESTLRMKVAKVLEFQLQYQSFRWLFMTDFL